MNFNRQDIPLLLRFSIVIALKCVKSKKPCYEIDLNKQATLRYLKRFPRMQSTLATIPTIKKEKTL